MSAVHKRLWTFLVLACTVLGASASIANATPVPHPQLGKLPGFPAIRGVMPVLGSQAAVSAREKLIGEAFAQAATHPLSGLKTAPSLKGVAVSNEGPFAPCEEFEEVLSLLTQDVCYRGGPVVHDPAIHLIFWKGEPSNSGIEKNVKRFPSKYISIITKYFKDVADDSGFFTNTYAVDEQYGEENSKKEYIPGEYAVKPVVEVEEDPAVLTSAKECTDESEYSKGDPCLFDSSVQEEVKKIAKTSEAGLGNIYVVLTPPGVGECYEEGECSYRQFCAYHGDFGGTGKQRQGQTLYAYMPYVGKVSGCDAGVHPNEEFTLGEEEEAERNNELLDEGADAAIDTLSHEINETITDPIGSQCDRESGKISGCELNAWTDAVGQEIGDKCLPPETVLAGFNGIYGKALGEVPGSLDRSYNQVIHHDLYWVQREWSNEASATELFSLPFGLPAGGCVQRVIPAGFSWSSSPAATVPVAFNGSSSGSPDDPATYWVWSFGDGEQVGTSNVSTTHTYAKAGTYLVTLTAYDSYGSSRGTYELITVGAAPPPMPPTPPTVIKEVIVPGHYTAAQVSAALGLPANGKKLSGFGPFTLGHAKCPPACGVTLQLYGKETKVVQRHRTSKWVLIGSVHVAVLANHSATLTLKPSAQGKALLHKIRSVPARLVVTVEGREGGTWQMVRALTVTANGTAARRARR